LPKEKGKLEMKQDEHYPHKNEESGLMNKVNVDVEYLWPW
jgi:hypothetical protein